MSMWTRLLTSTRGWRDSRRRHGRRYPWGMKKMSVSLSSPSPTAMASIDLSSGSSYSTTAPSSVSLKATAPVAPLTSSISTLSLQQGDNLWSLSLPGLKSASSDQCCNTTHYTRGLANSMTGESLPTLPESKTSTHWNKRQLPRYVSGRRAWPCIHQDDMLPAADWRQLEHPTSLLTSRTWDLSGNVGSLQGAAEFLPQHVDMLM